MLKVVNWNIRHGKGMDGIVDIRRIGEKLKTYGADVYTIQEIDRGLARTDFEDQAAILAEILGCEFNFTAISRVPTGEYGLATFTPLKIEMRESLKLSTTVENNSAQLTRIAVRQTVFDVVNLHAPWRHNQGYWKSFFSTYDFSNCIITGDFNLPTHSTIIREFRENYGWKNDNITTSNGKILDHTFIPKPFKIISQEIEPSKLSDHHILITTLDLW